MSGGLLKLLEIEAENRKIEDYEFVFDDFFEMHDGKPIIDVLEVPDATPNADYYLENDECICVVELKQIRTSEFGYTLMHRMFKFMSERGGVSVRIGDSKYAISGKETEKSKWLSFFNYIRPGVIDQLKAANRQLKATLPLVSNRNKPVVGGVMIFNTADENLPSDLLKLIVESKMKEEWENGRFRAVDFVVGGTLDMGFEGRHPQDCFLLQRISLDAATSRMIDRFWTNWKNYLVDEIGPEAHRSCPMRQSSDCEEYTSAFVGKLQRRI